MPIGCLLVMDFVIAYIMQFWGNILWWKCLVIKLVLNSHIFTHVHCIPHQTWPILIPLTVANARQGGELAAGSQHYKFFCCLQWSGREGDIMWHHETNMDSQKPFLQSCQACRDWILEKPFESFERPTSIHENELWDIRDVRKIHLASDDSGFGSPDTYLDKQPRRWTVNGVTTPSVSTALKTIRCMFVLPHGDRSRLQLPFSWEKHTNSWLVIIFESWRYFGWRNSGGKIMESLSLVRVVRIPSAHRAFASTWAHDCTSSKLSDWWCPRTVDLNSLLSGPFSCLGYTDALTTVTEEFHLGEQSWWVHSSISWSWKSYF